MVVQLCVKRQKSLPRNLTFKVIGKQVKAGSRGSSEKVWCTKNCIVRPKMQIFNKEKCDQAFDNNMMRKTFIMLMKQASTFAPCLTQHGLFKMIQDVAQRNQKSTSHVY